MDQIFTNICMKETMDSNLEACLNRYTKPQLKELAAVYNEKVSSSAKKQELVLKVEEMIKSNAIAWLKQDGAPLKALMDTLCKEERPISEIEDPDQLLMLCRRGLVFVRQEEDQVFAFVPQDVRVILDAPEPEVIKVRMPDLSFDKVEEEQAKYFEDQKKAMEEPQGPTPVPHRPADPDRTEQQKEIIDYARALSNMYGVYSVVQLKDVWDFNHQRHISPSDIDAAVAKIGDEDGIVTDGRMIANIALETVEACDEILEKTERRDVYFYPNEEEVQRFVDGPVLDDNEEYYFLRTFIARWIGFDNGASYNEEGLEKSGEILKEMYYLTMKDTPAAEIVTFLVERHISFTDLDEFSRFVDLYTMWSYQLRMWVVKGYKPAELKPVIAQRLNFKLPMDMDPMRRIKLGRNDACICGSGKKYKNCCMKYI